MNTIQTKRALWGRVAAGCLLVAGLAIATVLPAYADDDDYGWRGHKHKHHRQHYYGGEYYYYQPPVYYQPPPVYYQPPPVYYQPPPVYYQPVPWYYGPPSLTFVIPLDFD